MSLTNLNLSNVTKVSGGYGHSLAINNAGELYSWGLNSNGQLGDGTKTNRISPTRVGQDSDWVDVACGDYHSLALKNNGAVYAWGKNTLGQCGLTGGGDVVSPTAITVPGSSLIYQLAASNDVSLLLTNTSNVYGMGDNTYRMIQNSTTSFLSTPTLISDLSGSTLIAIGPTLCAAIRLGSIYVKGLLDFSTNSTYGPVITGVATLVPFSQNNNYVALDIGDDFLLAIEQNGKLYGYTFKAFNHTYNISQYSDATTIPPTYPSSAMTPIGAYGIIYRYIGLTSGLYRYVPDSNFLALIDDTQHWLRLACGRDHALLTTANGAVYSFGSNSQGQLGRTVTGSSSQLTQLESPASTGNWNVIGCGSFHSLLGLDSSSSNP
jgi:alpha-tubulin suppressor-like RCC1 family protein